MFINSFIKQGFLLGSLFSGILSQANPSLQPWEGNPWYWSIQDKPVLLLGGSDDDNLFQWPETKLVKQLDRLAEAGGNVIRNTMSDRKDTGNEVYPFKQLENGKYDLNDWNEEYWNRFERLLKETGEREIVVQIEIWDRFDYSRDNWLLHPYNPVNNINYTTEESGLKPEYPRHPGKNDQPFFFTTPRQRNNRVVLQYQERFIDKLLDISLKYGNVLYCMDNETSTVEDWPRYWAKWIRRRAEEAGKHVCLTEMWDNWDLRHEEHRRTFDHPELYDFVDVSQNNHNKGQKHWDNFLYVKEYLSDKPRPINTTKTYGADGNKFGHTDQDAVERFWRHLLAGAASMRFHRPPAGIGLNDKAVSTIRAARKLESLIPLWTVEPANDQLSERDQNEAYLAANPGSAYALYIPAGGEVSIDLSAVDGSVTIRWIQIETGEWGKVEHLKAEGKVHIQSPDEGNWAAAILPED